MDSAKKHLKQDSVEKLSFKSQTESRIPEEALKDFIS